MNLKRWFVSLAVAGLFFLYVRADKLDKLPLDEVSSNTGQSLASNLKKTLVRVEKEAELKPRDVREYADKLRKAKGRQSYEYNVFNGEEKIGDFNVDILSSGKEIATIVELDAHDNDIDGSFSGLEDIEHLYIGIRNKEGNTMKMARLEEESIEGSYYFWPIEENDRGTRLAEVLPNEGKVVRLDRDSNYSIGEGYDEEDLITDPASIFSLACEDPAQLNKDVYLTFGKTAKRCKIDVEKNKEGYRFRVKNKDFPLNLVVSNGNIECINMDVGGISLSMRPKDDR